MRRRDLLLTTLVVPLLPTSTPAQAQEKVWHVSVLTPNRFGESTIAISRSRCSRRFARPVPMPVRSHLRRSTSDAACLAELAIAAGLPTICEWPNSAKKGCLLGYGPDRSQLRRRTAQFIVRIFRGTSAGDLPIEDPTKFELVINLRTAKALDIEVPSWLLAQADEVVE